MFQQRGWTSYQDGDVTVVTPADGSWTVRKTRSFTTQDSSSTQIVESIWTANVPRVSGGTVVVGPTPPEQLRELTIHMIGALDGRMRGWLGIARVAGGETLRHLPSVDVRLLGLATDDAGAVGPLTGVADAVAGWCASYGSEREQPAVTFDAAGVRVRVRWTYCDHPTSSAPSSSWGDSARAA